MIISASRRTDIPAFYTPWLMNRVRAGFLLTRNPFNAQQIKRISLDPKDVAVIVFWTRNPSHLMPHLSELDNLGFGYYFQYTITGYQKLIETRVPNPQRAIETFSALSQMIGANKVIWRYDPILLSNLTDIDEHKRLFYKIARSLAGKTHKVVISFADFYQKTERNLKTIEGLDCFDIVQHREMLLGLASYLYQTAQSFDMAIETCAEEIDLAESGIQFGKCIDDRLIAKVFGLSLGYQKDKGQREACGCIKSVDIGTYNTCLHGCAYCYATFNHTTVVNNRQKHDPKSPFLLGGVEGVDPQLLMPNIKDDQITLF